MAPGVKKLVYRYTESLDQYLEAGCFLRYRLEDKVHVFPGSRGAEVEAMGAVAHSVEPIELKDIYILHKEGKL